MREVPTKFRQYKQRKAFLKRKRHVIDEHMSIFDAFHRELRIKPYKRVPNNRLKLA